MKKFQQLAAGFKDAMAELVATDPPPSICDSCQTVHWGLCREQPIEGAPPSLPSLDCKPEGGKLPWSPYEKPDRSTYLYWRERLTRVLDRHFAQYRAA